MGPFGSDIKVDNFISEGVPVLNGSNLTGIKLIENGFKYVSPEKAKTFKKAIAKRGDIVITHRGTLGQISFIPDNSKFDEYVISQSQFRVALNRKMVDPAYFVYYFHTSEGQKRLLANKCHVGVPALAQATTNFRLIEIPLPNLNTQQKIAYILSTLDSKIAHNNRINAELEAMAKTVYDYWFVQFEFPFDFAQGKPSAEGKPYKSNGGKMVWSEELKREVPEGWEMKTLKEIENDIITGKTPPTDNSNFYNGDVPFITIGDIRGNMHVVKTALTLSKLGGDYQKNKYIPKGSLCVTCIASPGLIAFATEPSQTNQQINSIVIHSEHNKSYLYYALNDYFKFANGAKIGNTFANMNKGDFESIEMIYPPVELLNKFEEFSAPINDKILSCLIENQQLSSLRDWLLPMLMNGQVSVGDEI